MKKIIICFVILLNVAFGAKLEVEISPTAPVAGESYNVTFKIEIEKGSNPIINFDTSNVEILSREETGTSTRTTYINGKLSVERTITVNYEVVSNKPTFAYFQKINVEIGGQVLKYKTVRVKIYKEEKRAKNIFVQAEVDKDEVFLGESIIVRYYLYNRVRVLSMDIEKFPSLDKFLKRFHQETTATERVQLESGIYERRIIYSAQLYSNKVGISSIDPISLSVGYASENERSSSNPFSNFGFRSMQSKKKRLRSKDLDIKVKALPNELPSGFTGLIGKHDIEFKINKSKFLVNEPIEINFTIKGPGALELYEEPSLIDSTKIESFDSTSDFTISKDFKSTKSFNITYLAREAGIIEGKKIPFVFFDPNELKFITKILEVPEIKIAGTSMSLNTKKAKKEKVVEKEKVIEEFNLNPIYKIKNTLVYNRLTLIIVILFIFLVWFSIFLYRNISFRPKAVQMDIYSKVIKNGANYADFYELIMSVQKGASLEEVINNIDIDSGHKTELLLVLSKLNKDFSEQRKDRVKISKKIVLSLKNLNER